MNTKMLQQLKLERKDHSMKIEATINLNAVLAEIIRLSLEKYAIQSIIQGLRMSHIHQIATEKNDPFSDKKYIEKLHEELQIFKEIDSLISRLQKYPP